MAELPIGQLAGFEKWAERLAPAIGSALAAFIIPTVSIGQMTVACLEVERVLEQTGRFLQTSFSISPVSSDELLIACPEDNAALMRHLHNGGEASDSPTILAEDQVEEAAAALSSIISAIAGALDNDLNDMGGTDEHHTGIGTITLSPSFVNDTHLVTLTIPINIPNANEVTATWYVTPAFVGLVSTPIEVEEEMEGKESGSISLEPEAQYGSLPADEDFGAWNPPAAASGARWLPNGMELVMDIPLDVAVELGRVKMLIKDIVELSSGSIVELDRVAGEPVDVLVNGKLAAKGEVVVIEDNFGIRITEIVSPHERLAGLGKRG